MGREQRRREEKKNKNLIKDEGQLDVTLKFSTLIKIVLVITLILFVLYYIIAVFITKEVDISSKKADETTENTDSVSNKILARTIFNQKESSYYVYFYDFNDEDENISTAIGNRSDLTIYRVNTKDGLNSNYVTEDKGNSNATSLDNLKVKNPTLIEITNDKITKYYEGSTAIINYLNG